MMFRLTEANVVWNNLSTSVTYEHMNSVFSSTHLQSIGGGGELGEPSRSNPDTLMPMLLEDPGAGVALPGVALLGAPMRHHALPNPEANLWRYRLAECWPHPL
jgi:hypothetical protein